ncbi:MAG: nitrogen fixation protein NifU [Candidatus Peregrinibacteria bacterium Greene1014_49]|nr:MAG: nitrogen fixation protein NifU [Candidatus Peregrinibacteria bacterium Greene1014_49]
MDLYAENILDHYRHPRNKQKLAPDLQYLVSHIEANLSCGDEISISLNINDNRILEISWDGTGCAISQAAMSLLSEELKDKTIQEIDALTPKEMYELLGVPIGPRRVKCALLGLHALKNAMRIRIGKDVQSWMETVGE